MRADERAEHEREREQHNREHSPLFHSPLFHCSSGHLGDYFEHQSHVLEQERQASFVQEERRERRLSIDGGGSGEGGGSGDG